MRNVTYPQKGIQALHDEYRNVLDSTGLDLKLSEFLNSDPNFAPLRIHTASEILTAPIDRLFMISNQFAHLVPNNRKNELRSIFNYDMAQSPQNRDIISKFFIDTIDLNLVTCFFCNIDHINSFDPIDDYVNWYDFFRHATKKELMQIREIGSKSADKIIDRRGTHPISSIGLNSKQLHSIRNFRFKSRVTHFTLDHILDKATHPIAAISFYNFVPSCYSCNSKFKGSTKLITSAELHYLSPTSSDFTFAKNIRFKIHFNANNTTVFTDINKSEDFVLTYEIDPGSEGYEKYIKIFKLRARYKFHKGVVLKLIEKRKKYSESQLREIAKITKVSVDQVKSDIFGEELFSTRHDASPLTKLKRDIARDIGITGVI